METETYVKVQPENRVGNVMGDTHGTKEVGTFRPPHYNTRAARVPIPFHINAISLIFQVQSGCRRRALDVLYSLEESDPGFLCKPSQSLPHTRAPSPFLS
jgi:hypothetical protein